jgi:uncharacterized protein YndB with AHSA1/START domain
MGDRSVTHHTFVIERTYSAARDRVFAAFADPKKKRRWYAEGDGHEVEEFEMDFRVGGAERARYRFKAGTPFAGASFTSNGSFQDIVPGSRVVTASSMAIGDRRISVSLATFELLATEDGTSLVFTHQGAFFEGSDGPQRREEGWRRLLEKFSAEVVRE